MFYVSHTNKFTGNNGGNEYIIYVRKDSVGRDTQTDIPM